MSKILVHLHGLIRPPDKAGPEKSHQERNAIYQLGIPARHVALIEVPMEVQERRRRGI